MIARGSAPGTKQTIKPHRGEVKHVTVISNALTPPLQGLSQIVYRLLGALPQAILRRAYGACCHSEIPDPKSSRRSKPRNRNFKRINAPPSGLGPDSLTVTWGVAPSYHTARLWRFFPIRNPQSKIDPLLRFAPFACFAGTFLRLSFSQLLGASRRAGHVNFGSGISDCGFEELAG
jgi:hypothetical protein